MYRSKQYQIYIWYQIQHIVSKTILISYQMLYIVLGTIYSTKQLLYIVSITIYKYQMLSGFYVQTLHFIELE